MGLASILIFVGLTVGFTVGALFTMKLRFPSITYDRRRKLAPVIGALIAMSPAYAAIAGEGFVAIFQVTVLAIVLALLVGFPTVVLFDTKPKD